MNGENRLIYGLGTHRNRLFWLLFLILGSTLISGIVVNVFYIDVILGLFLVIIGLYKLGEEIFSKNLKKEQERVSEDIDNVMEWLSHSYEFTKHLKNTHENRLHHLDKKRAEMGDKIENNYRDVVRKVIEVENKLSKTSRELGRERVLVNRVDKLAKLLVKERRMIEKKVYDVSDRQFKALKMIRKNGKITTSKYVKTFRIRDKTALRELKELIKKGFVKRKGKGRATHYVLGL